MKSRDFQIVISPSALPEMGHPASPLPEPGSLPTAKQKKFPPPCCWTAGEPSATRLARGGLGVGAEPEDRAMKPAGHCAGGRAFIGPARQRLSC